VAIFLTTDLGALYIINQPKIGTASPNSVPVDDLVFEMTMP